MTFVLSVALSWLPAVPSKQITMFSSFPYLVDELRSIMAL